MAPAVSSTFVVTVYEKANGGVVLKPLLLLHGMFGGPFVLAPLSELLSKRGYKVTVPDLYAGRRPPVRFADYRTLASAAADDIRQREGVAPVIIGHSMGGLIALSLASEAGALVLISAAPPRGIPVISWKLLRVLPRSLGAILGDRAVMPSRHEADVLMFNRIPETERALIYRQARPEGGAVCREVLLGVRVARPSGRILCLRGGDDSFVPPSAGKRIAKFCSVDDVVFPGAGHLLPLERPEETADLIDRWLNG